MEMKELQQIGEELPGKTHYPQKDGGSKFVQLGLLRDEEPQKTFSACKALKEKESHLRPSPACADCTSCPPVSQILGNCKHKFCS